MLLPQDIAVLLKMAARPHEPWTYAQLAQGLGLSPSQVHAAVGRAAISKLFSPQLRRPLIDNLVELLLHGVKYVYPPEIGGITRGMLTAGSHPAFLDEFMVSPVENHVWPHPQGTARGMAFSPLYKSAPLAARQDEQLYLALALVDALRLGRQREREFARRRLEQWLRGQRW